MKNLHGLSPVPTLDNQILALLGFARTRGYDVRIIAPGNEYHLQYWSNYRETWAPFRSSRNGADTLYHLAVGRAYLALHPEIIMEVNP